MSPSQPDEVNLHDAYAAAMRRLTLQLEQIVLLEAQVATLKREVKADDEGGVVFSD